MANTVILFAVAVFFVCVLFVTISFIAYLAIVDKMNWDDIIGIMKNAFLSEYEKDSAANPKL